MERWLAEWQNPIPPKTLKSSVGTGFFINVVIAAAALAYLK